MSQQDATERFYKVCWPHLSAVLRNARILSGNDAEADDLTQETMLKAFRSIDSFDHGTDALAWLTRILRNTRIDRIRARRRTDGQLSLDQLNEDPPAETHVEFLDDEELRQNPDAALNAFSDQQVIDALRQLPEEIRWTLLLVDVQGMDQAEAAEILNVPVGTIKSRAHRGRAMLRQALMLGVDHE